MKNSSAESIVVFTDADNTLWDTNAVFAAAQLSLLARIESAIDAKTPAADRLGFVREVDQFLAEGHYANLKYPPRLLAASISLVLLGKRPSLAVREVLSGVASSVPKTVDIGAVEEAFVADLQKIPELRPGVREGLAILCNTNINVIVITEGKKARCEKLMAHYAIADYVSHLLEGRKRPALYRRALAWAGDQRSSFMIGDQLDRDIGAASETGVTTVYFPGDFRPRWMPAEGEMHGSLPKWIGEAGQLSRKAGRARTTITCRCGGGRTRFVDERPYFSFRAKVCRAVLSAAEYRPRNAPRMEKISSCDRSI
jgi:putative hydrolase of the HAD superfamily